jgi:hypothetical protein
MKNFKLVILGLVLFLGYGWYKKQQLEAAVNNFISFNESGFNIKVLRSVLKNGYGIPFEITNQALSPDEVDILINFLTTRLGEMNPITQNAILQGSLKLSDLVSTLSPG